MEIDEMELARLDEVCLARQKIHCLLRAIFNGQAYSRIYSSFGVYINLALGILRPGAVNGMSHRT